MAEVLAVHVLLVEDNPGDAFLVKVALKAARYGRFSVIIADCLSAAMQSLHDHRFDVVLLDLSLPDSSGMDTIRAFRAAAPDIPIVVLTGLDDRMVGLSALREGCQDYLVKGNADGETTARTIIHSIQRNMLEVELLKAKEKLQAAYDDMERCVIERTSQLRRVAVEATVAEERERQAIARDLHDDLGQMLHVARIKLSQLTKPLPDPAREAVIGDLNTLIADASRMVRSLTSQLSPPTLAELGLPAALSWLADEMGRSHGLKVTIESNGTLIPPMPPAHSAILFRAVRELLINVAKHAAVDTARVTLGVAGGKLVLSVADKGIGMTDWRAALASAKGFGLASVQERITFLGGSMNIRTITDNGTTVTLEMPLDEPVGAMS